MLDLKHLELRIRPAPPYGDWIGALKLMGYSVVGLDLSEHEAPAFQAEAGDTVSCFVRGKSAFLPWVDSCGLEEALRRRKPPLPPGD